MRIAIVGSTGSGKTTLARDLAARFGVPHVELDALHWIGPGWTAATPEAFRAAVTDATRGEWIVDGNYGASM